MDISENIPKLDEIINDSTGNTSLYSRINFVKFLIKNFCLENLEVYIELSKIINQLELTQDITQVLQDWNFLLVTYIDSNAPKEINLPYDLKNQLINMKPIPDQQTLMFFLKYIKNYLHCHYTDFINYTITANDYTGNDSLMTPNSITSPSTSNNNHNNANNNDHNTTNSNNINNDENNDRCISPLSIVNQELNSNVIPRSNDCSYTTAPEPLTNFTQAIPINTNVNPKRNLSITSMSSIPYVGSASSYQVGSFDLNINKLIGKKLKFKRRSSNSSNDSN